LIQRQTAVRHFLNLLGLFPEVLGIAVFEQERVLDGVMEDHETIVVAHDHLIGVITLLLG
jgi:hypothetical protein